MKLEHEILVNQYGQDLVAVERLTSLFEGFEKDIRKAFLHDILHLIQQSKPKDEDIEPAIRQSGLKPTFTPCILIRKGVANHNLLKIIELPDNELKKSLVLLLNIFKIAYGRRFKLEKNNPNKWWYWDLSDKKKVEQVLFGL